METLWLMCCVCVVLMALTFPIIFTFGAMWSVNTVLKLQTWISQQKYLKMPICGYLLWKFGHEQNTFLMESVHIHCTSTVGKLIYSMLHLAIFTCACLGITWPEPQKEIWKRLQIAFSYCIQVNDFEYASHNLITQCRRQCVRQFIITPFYDKIFKI